MRHMIRGRQLSRDTEHRKSLRRSLVQSLFEHGMVRTTLPRAKEVRSMAERLITLARTTGEKSLAARRRVIQVLNDRRLVDKDQEFTGKTVVQKLFDEVAPKFAGRNGGYTRIIKLNEHRIGDGGNLVLLQLLMEESKPKGTARRSAGLRRKRAERRHQFAAKVLKKKDEQPAAEPTAETQPAEQKPAEQQP
jgi:large subunit ribosomal protein L17